MKTFKTRHVYLLLIALLGVMVVIGCTPSIEAVDPTVLSTTPLNLSNGAALNTLITATFSKEMNPSTITAKNFTVFKGATAVEGVVTYNVGAKVATFAPKANLDGSETKYTVTVKKAVTDTLGRPMLANKVWTFKTIVPGLGPLPVVLGTAGNYVILAKTKVVNIPTSVVTGNIGLSPAATSFVTGFSLTAITGGALSAQVIGIVHAADMAPPTNTNLTAAVTAMETAYTSAAGATLPAPIVNFAAGNLGGQTLTAGIYKFTTGVTIPQDVVFDGGANDVWILQIPGTLTVSNAKEIHLSGGAQAKNIFWQVAGNVTVGTTAHFEGIILGKVIIELQTSSTMNGMALGQTEVKLDHAIITKPPL